MNKRWLRGKVLKGKRKRYKWKKKTVLIQGWLWGAWDTKIAYETNGVGAPNQYWNRNGLNPGVTYFDGIWSTSWKES